MDGKTAYLFCLLSIGIGVFLCGGKAYSQPCDPATPSFVVDLSGNPDSTWISADTSREGHCCGVTGNVRCIEFLVTLSPDAEAIVFDIWSGAVPGGALFYQIDCGPPTQVGDPLCLVGAGPHRITFCKPGGNNNEYTIVSIPKPSAGSDVAVNDGCSGTMFANGYDVSTITWTSVFPGLVGDYNSYLSCTFICDSTVAIGDVFAPPFVDYQVCGTPLGGCDTLLLVCDTVRVYFNTELFAQISPLLPTICFGNTTVPITANGIGGTPPYSWLWSTGDTTQSINANAGTYWVLVSDTSYPSCPPAYDTIVVTSFTSAINADAGIDQTVCINTDSIQLSGVVTAASGGVWSGGSGVFLPDSATLNAIYIPDSVEIAGGSVTLVLTTTGNGSCPADTDTVTISIISFQLTISKNKGTKCGECKGDIHIELTGGATPYDTISVSPQQLDEDFFWSGPTQFKCHDCCVGTRTFTFTDANGCIISVPVATSLKDFGPAEIDASTNVSCFGGSDGTATADLDNGEDPFTYLWLPDSQTTETAIGLSAGVYTVIVTDADTCSDTTTVTITQPDSALSFFATLTDVTCNGGCDGVVTASGTGGTPSYDYSWTPSGGTSTNNDTLIASGLCAGTYSLYIQDDNDCDTTVTIVITEPSVLSGTITSIINVSCNGDSTGQATVTPSGGLPPYTYLWDDPLAQTTATASGLPALDHYHVGITDSGGCTIEVEVIITEPLVFSASIIGTDVSCSGGNDGTATVTPSGGTPLYTYLWSTSPVQTTATATGLVAGLYTLTVTDFKGCSTTANITIGEPTPLIATITSATDVSCFGGTDGDATATAINGTAPYTYLWNTNPVQTNVSATGLSAGIYTVTITDTNGCNATANVIINNPSPLSLSIAIVTLPSNCGASDGEACVATTGGLTPYTYFWNTSPVQNTACAAGLPTGSISIIVSDSNGCAIAGVAVIGDLNVVIALDSVQDVTCYGGNDGQVSITVSGATPPYTYLWDDPNSQTTPVATGLTAGTYLITVTDPNNCGSALSITVNQPLPIIDSIATTDLTCFGDKTGQATVTSSGEYPPYTYLWNTAPPQNAATATGLSGGGYTVIVTDGRGCATSSIVNISQPNLLTANISSTNVSCNGVNDGSAVVTGTGGVSPYSYLWNPGGQTTAAVNNLQPLNYTVTVTDVNGCDTSATVTITEPTGLTLSLTGTNVSCNGFCDGQIVANLSGGTPVYTYFWSTTPFQSNATATGLCPGNYTLTALDSNGCDTTANATITEPPLLTGSITSVNHVTCNGANDGDASVTPSGGTLPYSYLWNDPSAQTDSTAVGLFAGTYTVAVTDGNGCSILKTVTVIEPGLLTSVVGGSTNISCNGADDGQATVTTTGGTPTYTYLWNDPSAQTTSTAVGLAPGNYSVTISDINGCSTVTNTNITEPAVLTAAISGSGNMSCFGVNDGSITVVGLGGTAPYSYLWDDISVQSTATANGLSAGSYTVIVTDANGCDTTATDSIIEPPLLTQSITSVFDVGCTGACDGVASVAASGGTPGYTYVWSTTPFQSNDTATGLCPGAYPVTVADTNGCTVADTVIINEPAILTASILPPVIHVSCKGGNDGAATVLALGGSPPYSYLWNDPSAQTTATASGLVAGTYTVVVTDSNSCNSSGNVTVTINEPAQFLAISIIDSLDVSCNGGSDGEAIALASGGTPFYTYLWGVVPPQFTATATGLLAGTYAVTVLDGNGCDTTATVTINEPTVLAITFTDSVNVSCKGGNDGSATVGVSGGMTPYSYLWNTNPAQTDTAAIGLVGGTYTVTVTDSNNCAVSVSISITDPDSLSLSITETAANCGNPDGAASVAVTGGTSPFSYLWSSGGVTNDSIAGLFAGVYTVNVTDAKGCIDSAIALVNDIVVFVVQDSTANLTCFGGSNGTIDILVTSGTRPFTYDWSHDSLVNDTFVTGLAAGVYYLTVTDSNGCKSTKQFNISGPVAILDSIDIQNVTCNGDSNGQAAVFPIGGTPPYSYLWNTVPPQTDSFATGLDAGTYNITVTDSLGCDTVTIISIIEPDTLTATITSVTNASCNGLCDGSATVSSLGGTSPIGYSWDTSPVKIDSTATGLCPGAYTVTLMDVNGCLANADTVIAEPDTLSVSMINVVNVSCSGYQDGQATASAIGGTPGYGFLWTSVTPVQMDSIATGLGPITHTVTVTDTNGCSATATVTITEPGVFAASLGVVTHVSCNGGNDGSASAIPFGGTTPYSYSWSTAPLQTDSTAIGLSAGTDTVIVSDLNGCSDTVTVTINEPPLLTASITDSINISCFGGNNGEATVTAGGGSGLYAYLWSDSNTQTTQTAIGLLAGNYSVTITDDDSCSSIVNVTLTEPSQLTASITSSINVSCGGGNDGLMVVSGTGGTPPYTYLWDDDSTQVSDSAIALNAGIYTVIITDTMGCDTSASDTITEPAFLVAVISSVANVSCKGDATGSATVNASGGTAPYTYLWNDSNAQTDTMATALLADTFNVTVTDFMGCDTTITAVVTEPDSLILSISNIIHVACNGDSTGEATATVTGGTSPYIYLWSTPDTVSQTTGLLAGTWSVIVTDTSGCVVYDTVIITESPPILVSASNDTLICTGDNALISVIASGGAGTLTYTWSDPFLNGTGPFAVSPVDTTNYTVTVTDGLGCNSIDSVKVSVGPVIILFGVDDSICVGDSTTISSIVTGGDGNYSYLWETGDTTNSITVNPTVSTYYTLIVDDGCATPPVIDSVFVEVNPYPQLELLPADAHACQSGTIGFIDMVADILGSTYFWDFGDGNTDTTANPSVNYTYFNTGIFSVSVSVMSPKGCQTDSLNFGTVIISPAPTANFMSTPIYDTVLQPSADFSDESYGDPIIGDTISSWYWDFGDGNSSTEQDPTHTFPDTGTYPVMLAVINEYGCPDTIIKTMIICSDQPPSSNILVLSPLPISTCSADPAVTSTAVTEFPTINFISANSDIYSYHWDFGDGDTTNDENPMHVYNDSGTYSTVVTTTNIFGCVNTCSLDVVINPFFEIKVPNAFTPDPSGPNGGVYNVNIFDNNVFFPVTQFVDEFHMMIFNRWGELVFESFDIDIGWDGYYRDNLSQADAYAWKIEVRFIQGKVVKLVGDVTLIR